MTQHWAPTTLELTSKQARLAWHMLRDEEDRLERLIASRAQTGQHNISRLRTIRAIIRKLE